MKSSFFEFHVATTALFTARGNLQVVSHNVANAETPGFSRQYAMQRTNTPLALYNGKGMVGTGSEVYGIGQVRDFYLDKKYWSERAVLGEYGVKKVQLDTVEAVFNDLNEGGLTNVFNDFFSKMQSLSENAGSATHRTNLIQSANTMISFVQLQANALKKQQQDINVEMKAIVDRINSIAQQIGSLNKQIVTSETDGSVACDLRDERAKLIDELSVYVNVKVDEKEVNPDFAAGKYPDPEDRNKSNKQFSVLIDGYELVNHFNVQKLKIEPRKDPDLGTTPPGLPEKYNELDNDGLFDLRFENGIKFNIYSTTLKGELKGLIDVRDGNGTMTYVMNNGEVYHTRPAGPPPTPTFDPANGDREYNTSYKGIPYYLDKLNELVRTFARAMNEGLDKDGQPMKGIHDGTKGGHIAGASRGEPYDTGWFFFTNKDDAIVNANTLTALNPPPDLSVFDYGKLNVFNIAVNPELVDDPYKISAADVDVAVTDPGESDNNIILKLLKINSDIHLFREGKLSDYINSISSSLAIDINQATKFEKNYTDVTVAIDNQRIAVSGVSLDEEIINMIKYQQLYQAAAKLINIIDSIYDITINRLGNF